MKRTMAVILAGGEGERLSILSSIRAKPAVPFGGKYRIIDFTLSNCVNSDVDDVVVLTQYNPRSLNDHIGLGRPWDLDRNRGGVKMLQPYIARGRVAEWYRGTADAVLQNINVIEHDSSADTILVLAGDHIYKMDYQPFIAAHRRRRADVTIAVRHVPLSDATRMGVLALDDGDRVIDWQEKPKQPKSDLASMGVYVFTKKALRRWLGEDRDDFGKHVIPAMLDAGARVFGYRFDGYWQDVGTIQSYWEANLALLHDNAELDLYDKEWVIHTRSEERAPAKIGPTAQVHRSLISHGCMINGTVVNSVLSPGVRVDVGAVVRDSIVMFDCVIRSGAVVDRSILDKEVVVGPGAIVGDGPDFDTPNRQEPGRLNTGITVVGKRAIIPRGVRIGRNVKIAGGCRTSDFLTRVIRNGASVEARAEKKPRRGTGTPAISASGEAAATAATAVRSDAAGDGHDGPSAVSVGGAGRRRVSAVGDEVRGI
ncbi:MAG TPA: sugar phosphate nucleotidyltransferase [Candidatus Limnocylindrales bacterium]|nr:sugar phosphate nucleotidyltransferase [Candidatus Limnocylindrales bacterium]